MSPEAFEETLSAWLDAPEDAALRAQIEAAVARDPQLRRLRDQYLRLQTLLTAAIARRAGVDWQRLQARIVGACSADDTGIPDDAVDALLRRATGVDALVDWPRLRQRITSAALGQTGQGTASRFGGRLRRAAGVVAVTAAAAVLLLLVRLPVTGPASTPGGPSVTATGGGVPPTGSAQATVVNTARASSGSTGYARATLSPPTPGVEAPTAAPAAQAVVFLIMDAPKPASDSSVNEALFY
jgi:hypothetical protein